MCPSSDPRLHRSPVTWGQHKTLHTRRHTQGSTLLPHRQCHEHHLGPRITAGPGAEQGASAQGSGAFPLLLSPSQCDLLALAGNTSSPALLQIRLVASWEWIRACNSAAVTEACQDQRYSSSAFNPLTFNRKCTQLAGVAGTQEPGSWQDPSQATGPLLIPKVSALQS